MDPTYAITIEPERKLLRIVMSGFFAFENAAQLEIDRHAALVRLGCARNQHVTLVDVTACKLQPQDVVLAFQVALANPRYMSRRIALVTGNSGVRMQVRRVTTPSHANFFETTEAAEAWLFEEVRPDARAALAPLLVLAREAPIFGVNDKTKYQNRAADPAANR
jgi:hypothetical protein